MSGAASGLEILSFQIDGVGDIDPRRCVVDQELVESECVAGGGDGVGEGVYTSCRSVGVIVGFGFMSGMAMVVVMRVVIPIAFVGMCMPVFMAVCV